LADETYEQGLDAVTDISSYGKELAQQHLELIQKFGRNPFRNCILDRESTKEESEFMITFM